MQTAFLLARHLTAKWLQDCGDVIPAHRLFPRVLAFVHRFLAEKVECIGDRQLCDIAIAPYYSRATEGLYGAMVAEDMAGKAELPIVPTGAAGIRSKAQVNFYTAKDLWPVEHCHLNAMVADTEQWEQSAAFALDTHPGVLAWVKNDRLGLKMPIEGRA